VKGCSSLSTSQVQSIYWRNLAKIHSTRSFRRRLRNFENADFRRWRVTKAQLCTLSLARCMYVSLEGGSTASEHSIIDIIKAYSTQTTLLLCWAISEGGSTVRVSRDRETHWARSFTCHFFRPLKPTPLSSSLWLLHQH